MAGLTVRNPAQGRPAGRLRAARRGRRATWVAWFLLPGLALFVGLVLLPIIVAALLSFSSWNGSGAIRLTGFGNWIEFIHDPSAAAALERTGILVVASWLIQEPIALALGIFVAGRQIHRVFLATIFFLPALFSSAALGILWSQLLSPVNGGVQYAGSHFGLAFLNHDWLGDVHLVLAAVIVLVAWQFIPFHTLLYQAGVRQIPRSLYEAAALDGITAWARVRRITIPMLRNTIVTSSTLNVVGSLTVFDLIYTLTTGGPGQSTRVLALDQYLEGFSSFNFGYASALGLVLGVLGMVIAIVLVKVTGFGKMRSQAEGV
jgi:raffinose/stachyose/melibiose transport system permease protein